jgi:integrase/recombinase XerD
MNFERALEGFEVARIAEGYSEDTVERYHCCLILLFRYLGDVDVKNISHNDVQSFFHYLRTEYVPNRANGNTGELSTASMHAIWKAIRSFFNWAEDDIGLARPDTRLKAPRYSSAEIQPFTQDEIGVLLKACEFTAPTIAKGRASYRQKRATGLRDKANVLTLLDTGLRASEICRLDVENVNLDLGEIRVQPFGAGQKTKPRTVFVGRASKKVLWQFMANRDETEASAPLLLTIQECRMNRHNLRSMLRRLGKRAGVPKVHAHRFRHTFAIQYLRNSGDVFSLQRILGHSTLSMVNRYLALASADVAIAHRRASPVDNWQK